MMATLQQAHPNAMIYTAILDSQALGDVRGDGFKLLPGKPIGLNRPSGPQQR